MAGIEDLRGAVVVVTGASSGLGRATAVAFAEQGARLVLAARTEPALQDVAALCAQRGAETLVVRTDIRDPGQVGELADRAVERFGRIDVWVEAAAVLIAGRLEDHPVGEIQELVNTNVAGSAFGARAAVRVFRRQRRGVLIMVSSLHGVVPSPLLPAYVMSKYATRGLALSLRQSLTDLSDVDVCSVLPGPIDTPVYQRAGNFTGRQLRAVPPAVAPERVAAKILACARRPRRETTAGLLPHLVLVSHRVAPRLTEWLGARYSGVTVTRPTAAPDRPGAVTTPVKLLATSGGWRKVRLRRRLGKLVASWRAGGAPAR